MKYIKTLKIDGAILIFLPGWNLIFALHKHLEMHPEFGKLKVVIFSRHLLQLSPAHLSAYTLWKPILQTKWTPIKGAV